MNQGSLIIMVDTCVWLDLFFRDRPNAAESEGFFTAARAAGANLLYGASKLETLFYLSNASAKATVRREKGSLSPADAEFARQYAWNCVDMVRELGTAADVGMADLWLAGKFRNICPDFEDNVLMATAERVSADYLVTWDEDLLRVAGAMTRAVTPRVMMAILRDVVLV